MKSGHLSLYYDFSFAWIIIEALQRMPGRAGSILMHCRPLEWYSHNILHFQKNNNGFNSLSWTGHWFYCSSEYFFCQIGQYFKQYFMHTKNMIKQQTQSHVNHLTDNIWMSLCNGQDFWRRNIGFAIVVLSNLLSDFVRNEMLFKMRLEIEGYLYAYNFIYIELH